MTRSRPDSPVALRWHVYVALGIATAAMVCTVGYSLHMGDRALRVYAPLMNAAMGIKLEAAIAHLWFEEILSGDRHESIEDVWQHLDQAAWYADAMLEGGANEKGTFIALGDPELRREVEGVRTKIARFRTVAEQRYASRDRAKAGTGIDQRFDAVFHDFMAQADGVARALRRLMQVQRRSFLAIQAGLGVAYVALSVLAVGVLRRQGRRRRLYSQELGRNEKRLRSVVESMPVMLDAFDEKGILLTWNGECERVTGYAEGELVGNPRAMEILYPDPDYREKMVKAWAERGDSYRDWEWNITCKDGSVRTIAWSNISDVFPIPGWASWGVGLDVTGRKRTEQELRDARGELGQRVRERTTELRERIQESEQLNRAMVNLLEDHQESNRRLKEAKAALESANRELETFSYSVSHDLRAPLRAVDGFSKALMEDCADRLDSEGLDYLQCLREASQNMGRLIDDLLALSRVARDPMRKEQIDLREIAEDVVSELREDDPERNVAFAVSDGLSAEGDPGLMRVVLMNLLGNAWKFTRGTESPQVEFGVTGEGNQPVYHVRDNGAGFDMAHANKLFGPFQRLHAVHEFEGSGIGLATVQRIVHRHGGRVWAEGAPGEGATFYFTLAPEQEKSP